jgi:hypothetical protein
MTWAARRRDFMYVSELNSRRSILDLEGNLVGRIGGEPSFDPGHLAYPHCIWKDSEESLYVGEVLDGAHLQKFARVA